MENGVNVTDVGTLAGLRAVGGYGYGNFAGDGSAVNAGIRGNRDITLLEAVNRNSSAQFLGNQIDRGHQSINDNINTTNQFLSDRIWSQGIDSKFAAVTAQFASAERLAFANKADTDRELKAIELKQTECCCELRAGQAAILAELKCNREVTEARQAGLNEAKIDAILAAQK